MKNYPIQFSTGQFVFAMVCLLAGGLLDFYLGAKFGPEIFWGIRLEQSTEGGLLPDEKAEAEYLALLQAQGQTQPLLHQELEKKTAIKAIPEPVPVVVAEKKPDEIKDVLEAPKLPEVAKPAPAAKPEEEIKPVAPQQSATPRYALQVGSYGQLKQAQDLEQKLKSGGYTVTISTVTLPGKGQWYRVHTGGFSNEDEAQKEMAVLRNRFGIMPVVVIK